MPIPLSPEEQGRYRRQLQMPEVGESGQQRLKAASVAIAGIGGLGGLCAYYMAAAGVGHLRLADMDRVAVHNLNRQLLYGSGDIGKQKTDCARARLTDLNPLCQIETLQTRITADTVAKLIDGCDLVIDGTDNLLSRRVLNQAAWERQIPFIYGGVNGFNGIMAAFIPGKTACLECVFPETDSTEPVSGHIIGPTAGVIAALQSTQALKRLIGQDAGKSAEIIHFRGLDMRFRKITVDRNPDCRVCSTRLSRNPLNE